MNNVVIKNYELFENTINKIEDSYQNIMDIFEEEKIYIERINETETWTGEAQRTIYKKYKQLEKNYEPIEETLKIYINFLRNTLDSYKKLEDHLIQNLSNNNSNLDVNS